MSRIYSLFKYLIGWPLSLVATFFVLKIILSQKDIVAMHITRIEISLLFYGVLCFIGYYFIRTIVWQQILKAKGHQLPLKGAAYLWASSELKRYVPGNIWSFLGRTILFHSAGVSKKVILSSLVVEAELVILSLLIASSLVLPFLLTHFLWFIPNKPAFFNLIILFIILFTSFFIWNKQLAKRLPLLPEFSPQTNAFLVFLYSVAFFLFGLGNYLVASSLFFLTPTLLLTFIGIFIFAVFVGYLSIVTPMGLGVREGVITISLSKVLESTVSGFIAIYLRIILIFSELVFLGLVFFWRRLKADTMSVLEKAMAKNTYTVIMLLFMLVYIVYFTSVSFLRFENFYTGRFDLGNMDQTVWNTLHGRVFQMTNPDTAENVSRLAFHADFLLLLLSPLYLLWSDPRMLLFIQSVSVALGGLFAYLLANEVLKSKPLALTFGVVFLLNPALQFANLYDFHAVTLTTTFLLASFYFIIKRKYVLFALLLFLAALTKEHVWFIAALFGVYIAVVQRKIAVGAMVSLVCLSIFYFLFWHAIPASRGGHHFAVGHYSDFGSSPQDIARTVIISPEKVIATILKNEQQKYLMQLFTPLGYLPLLSPLYLIFAVPDLLINLLSKTEQLHQIYYHYSAVIIPFLFISAVFGVKRLITIFPRIPHAFYICYLLLSTLYAAYSFGPLPGAKNPSIDMLIKPRENKEIIYTVLSRVPKTLSVASSNNLGAHISQRENVYTIPIGTFKADVIALYLEDSVNENVQSQEYTLYQQLKYDKRYTLLYKLDKFVLFQKNTSCIHNACLQSAW